MVKKIFIVIIFLYSITAEIKAETLSSQHSLWTKTNYEKQDVLEEDSLALVALFHSCNGSGWYSSSGWLKAPITDWVGITIENGRVTTINFAFFFADGQLFWGNNLTGQIPIEIGNLTALTKLDLSFSAITGIIPQEIGNLVDLQSLSIADNQLEGELPASITNLTELFILELTDNLLSGTLPERLGNLTALQHLYLDGNNFSGTLPASLGDLSQLKVARLHFNQFSGEIPSSIGKLTQLQSLLLSDNLFSEKLPNTLSNLNTTQINIKYNYLDFSAILNSESSTFATNWKYAPQRTIFEIDIVEDDTALVVRDGKHPANTYQWYINEETLNKNNDTILVANEGFFYCKVSNRLLSNLVIWSDSVLIQAPNHSPIADAGNDTSFCWGSAIQLSALKSTDPDNDDLIFEWGTPEAVLLSNYNAPTPELTVLDEISATTHYSVTLSVSDGYFTSTDSLEITVHPSPAQPTISINGNLLTSSSAFGNQWYLNEMEIEGATEADYMIDQSGYYSIQVTSDEGCQSEISESQYFIFTDVEYVFKGKTIYPNPTNGKIFIGGLTNREQSKIEIFDVCGNRIQEQTCSYGFVIIDLSMQPSGIYFIHLNRNNKPIKVIKQ